MMLKLNSKIAHTECRFCKHVTDIRDLIGETVVNRKELSHRKEWLEEATEEIKKERPTTREECPKCENDVAYFEARQMRSADEGQTVFYECKSCGHKWSVNT